MDYEQLECERRGGHWCGDDEDNWTKVSYDGCVPKSSLCDGTADCADESDEYACEDKAESESACLADDGYYCGDEEDNWTVFSPNGCVLGIFLCDGYNDCRDGSDNKADAECKDIQ